MRGEAQAGEPVGLLEQPEPLERRGEHDERQQAQRGEQRRQQPARFAPGPALRGGHDRERQRGDGQQLPEARAGVLRVRQPGRLEHVLVAAEQRRQLQRDEGREQGDERAERRRPLEPAEGVARRPRADHRRTQPDVGQRAAQRDHDRGQHDPAEGLVGSRDGVLDQLREGRVGARQQRHEDGQQDHGEGGAASGCAGVAAEADPAGRRAAGEHRADGQPRPERTEPAEQLAPATPAAGGQRGQRGRGEQARDDDPLRRPQHRHEREHGRERPPHARPPVARRRLGLAQVHPRHGDEPRQPQHDRAERQQHDRHAQAERLADERRAGQHADPHDRPPGPRRRHLGRQPRPPPPTRGVH